MKNFYFIFFLFFLGCVSKPKIKELPEWIENPHILYPESFYLAAVGSGSSLEEAKERAITSLSSIFSVEVNLNRKILEIYTEKKKEKEIDWEHSVNLVNRSVLKSENKLINVRTPKTYFDEETTTFYVLSIIDKAETEVLYRKEIEKNDEAIIRVYREAKNTKNKITKLIYFKRCVELIKIGEALRSIHRVLSLENTPILPISKEELQIELEILKNALVAKIETSGGKKEELYSFLKEILNQTGFSVGEVNPDIIIKGKLEIKDLDFPREGEFILWELTIDVRDSSTGNIMNTFIVSGREGHIIREGAIRRALNRVKEELNTNFYKTFTGFLINTSE
ncbi:MAG: LPP20 family lipoprotein [candidate division WOR-3 bacterium]